jgi:2-octaprenyl-6-methoxyphenol hydroxylase
MSPSDSATDFDVLIAGGGMVGAGLALALRGSGLRVAVVEAEPPGSADQPSYDDRAIALAYGSRCILGALGVWPALAPDAEPILRIHVSDRGRFGFSRLDHRDEGVEALGYVVTARGLGRALLPRIEQAEDLHWLCPARLQGFRLGPDVVQADLDQDGIRRRVTARLLVGADGRRSRVRTELGIAAREWTYGHHAVIANLTPGRPHGGVAFERFTDTGPMAMLPMTEGRCALVWTVRDGQLDEILGLSDAAFLERLQARFGYRLGRLRQVGRRSAYPLCQIYAREHVRARLALVGNAAHTVHPVAGQGFNLGIRDAAALAEVLIDAAAAGKDPGALEALQIYQRSRRRDHRTVLLATDALARLFTSPLAPVRTLRDLGMLGIDLIPWARHLLARQAMGLGGRLARLARGTRHD